MRILIKTDLLCTGISARLALSRVQDYQVLHSACPLSLPMCHLQHQLGAQLEQQGQGRPEWKKVQKQAWHPAPTANTTGGD